MKLLSTLCAIPTLAIVSRASSSQTEELQDSLTIFGRELSGYQGSRFSGPFHLMLSERVTKCSSNGWRALYGYTSNGGRRGGRRKQCKKMRLCMEYNDSNICGVNTCNESEARQQFQYGFDTKQFKVNGYDDCMTLLPSGQIRMKACNVRNRNQRFDVIPAPRERGDSDFVRFALQPELRNDDCIARPGLRFSEREQWEELSSHECPKEDTEDEDEDEDFFDRADDRDRFDPGVFFSAF